MKSSMHVKRKSKESLHVSAQSRLFCMHGGRAVERSSMSNNSASPKRLALQVSNKYNKGNRNTESTECIEQQLPHINWSLTSIQGRRRATRWVPWFAVFISIMSRGEAEQKKSWHQLCSPSCLFVSSAALKWHELDWCEVTCPQQVLHHHYTIRKLPLLTYTQLCRSIFKSPKVNVTRPASPDCYAIKVASRLETTRLY